MDEKENIANSMAEDDDDDDEAFLPPGFLMPQKASGETSIPLALEDFLAEEGSSSNGVESDILADATSADRDSYYEGNNQAAIDLYLEDSLDVEGGSQQRDAATQYEEPRDDDDAALGEKLDALAAAIQEEVEAGTQMMKDMEDSSDPGSTATNEPEEVETERTTISVNSSTAKVDACVQTASLPDERDTTIAQQQEMIESLQKEKEELASELQNGEATNSLVDLIEELKKENAQLLAQRNEQAAHVEQLDAQNSQLTFELQQANQIDATREESGIQQMELIEQLKDKHHQLTVEKDNSLQQFNEQQTNYESQLSLLREEKDRELQELRTVIEGQRTAFVEAKQASGKVRSLQRHIGSLEAELKESKAENDAAAEAAKNDKAKIRSLQRRVGALRAAQQASKEATESDKNKIRSLQRQLGSSEAERKDVEAFRGKIKSLQRRTGALQSELQEHESTHATEITEMVQVKDHEIEYLQKRLDDLQGQLESRTTSFESSLSEKHQEIVELQSQIESLEHVLQQRSLEDTTNAEQVALAKRQEIENLQGRIDVLEADLLDKNGELDIAKSLVRSQHDDHQQQSRVIEQEHESRRREIESLNKQIQKLEVRSIAQAAAFEGLKRLKDRDVAKLEHQIGSYDDKLKMQAVSLSSKEREMSNLQSCLASLQADRQNEEGQRTELEDLQRRILSMEDELVESREKIATYTSQQQQSMALKARYEKHVAHLHSEKELFAQVARDAMDETNRMFSDKLASLQSIIDRQRVDIDMEVALNEVRGKEHAEEMAELKNACSELEEDLSAVLERESEMEEKFASALAAAEEQINVLAKTHADAMGHLQEQYDLVEQELFEALDREEEYSEERELIMTDCELQVAALQSSLSNIQETKDRAVRDYEAASVHAEKVQYERDEARSRVAQLEYFLQTVQQEIGSTKQSKKLMEDENVALRLALVGVQEESVADRVTLFKQCLAFFEKQKADVETTFRRQIAEIVRECDETIKAIKDEHTVDMVNFFRLIRNESACGISLEEHASPPVVPFDQSAPADLKPLPVVVKIASPARDLTSKSVGLTATMESPTTVKVFQSPTSAFNPRKTPARDLTSNSVEPTATLETSKVEKAFQSPTSAFNPCKKVPQDVEAKLEKSPEQPVGNTLDTKDATEPDGRASAEPQLNRTERSITSDGTPIVDKPVLGKKTRFAEPPLPLSSPVPTSLTCGTLAPAATTPMDSRKIGKVCLDFSTPGFKSEKIEHARTTPNISAAKAKLRAMEAKRHALRIPSTATANIDKQNRSTDRIDTTNRAPLTGSNPANNSKSKLPGGSTATTSSSSLQRPSHRSSLAPPTVTRGRLQKREPNSIAKPVESSLRGRTRVPLAASKRTNLSLSKHPSRLLKKATSSTGSLSQSHGSKPSNSTGLKPALERKKTITKPTNSHEVKIQSNRALQKPSSRSSLLGTKQKSRLSQYGTSSRRLSTSTSALAFTNVQKVSSSTKSSLHSTPRTVVTSSAQRPRSSSSRALESAAKTSPKQEDLFDKLAELKVSAATPLLSTTKKLPRKPPVPESLEKSSLPSELTFNLASTTKRKSDGSSRREDSSAFSTKRVRFNHTQDKNMTPIVRKNLSNKLAKRQVTPLRVGQEIFDLFSPESPLLTPIRVKARKTSKKEEAAARCQAAIRIQSIARKFIAVRLLQRAREEDERRQAAIKIQSSIRRFNDAVLVVKIKYDKTQQERYRAATRIQSVMRRQLAIFCTENLRTSRAQLRAAVRIQSRIRQYQAYVLAQKKRDILVHETQLEAILRIQSNMRKVLAVMYFQKARSAAATIQKHWRGSKIRFHLAAQERAVLVLQALVRAFLGAAASKRSAIVLQSYARMVLAKNRAWDLRLQRQEMLSSAVLIQRVWRMHEAAKTLNVCREAAMTLQSWTRRNSASSALKKLRVDALVLNAKAKENAALTIQKTWRMKICRKSFIATVTNLRSIRSTSATKIQSSWRTHFQRRYYREILSKAILLQAFVRQINAQRTFTARIEGLKFIQSSAAAKIQSGWRMHAWRCYYVGVLCDVSVLQAFGRQIIAQRQVEEHRRSVTAASVQIQSCWRMHDCKRTFGILLGSLRFIQSSAAIKIQSGWRRHACRYNYVSVLSGILVLQSFVRRNIVHRRAEEYKLVANAAAVRIQSHWRMVSGRRVFRWLYKAAATIQGLFRGAIQRRKNLKQQVAAIKIQSAWRMKIFNLEYVSLRASAITIQGLCRDVIERRAHLKERTAATKIQSFCRMVTCRDDYRLLYQSTVTIQGLFRGAVQRQISKLQHSAATQIQTQWRALLQRKHFKSYRQSAIALQRFVRGFLARRTLSMYKSQSHAAILIQSHWRTYAAQKAFTTMYRTAITLQKLVRGFLARHQVKALMERHFAATILQQNWRTMIDQRQMLAIKTATVVVQGRIRGFLARSRFQMVLVERSSSTIVVQSWWRMVVVQKQFKVACSAALTLQAALRKFLAQKENDSQHRAATVLQSKWRMSLSRMRYIKTKGALLNVQSVCRGFLGRKCAKKLTTQSRSATMVQCFWRMHSSKARYAKTKKAAMKVQSVFRSFLDRQHVAELASRQRSALTLQTQWRKVLIQKRYSMSRRAILVLQPMCRGFLARQYTKKLIESGKACTRLQSTWRAGCVRATYKKAILGFVLLQARMRGQLARRLLGEMVAKTKSTIQEPSKSPALEVGTENDSTPVMPMVSIKKPQRKVLGNLSVSDVPKKSATKASRQPFETSSKGGYILSPLKTRRGTRVSIAPGGENSVGNTIRTRASLSRQAPKPRAGIAPGSESRGGNTSIRTRTSLSGKTRASLAPAAQAEDANDAQNELRAVVEKLKVVDLRQELKDYRVESKEYRGMRKAELVTLVVAHRMG